MDNSSNSTDIRLRQEPEMDTQRIKTPASELTLISVDEQIKQSTDQSSDE